MITKGGLNSATQNLAIEYAKAGIRFNAVAPGEVDTPMRQNDPKESTSQPAMIKATVNDIVDAVLYLAQADHVSGEILHVDCAAPPRRWQ
jgi:NAD(P)-dependent dehydrogenase (short-subunit alcohol dehydrogenase family)